jgi:cytoskeleton protein RodZ
MTVGKAITAARNRKGLSVAVLASTTRILPATIEAIEADDYRKLPSAVYVRGFVRSIAVVLDMNVERTLTSFDRQVAMPGPGEGDDMPLALTYGEDDVVPEHAPNIRFGTVAAIAMVALMVGFFYLSGQDENVPQAEASTTDVMDSRTVK